MKFKWVLALLAVAVGVGVGASSLLATPQSGLTATQLAKGSVGRINVAIPHQISVRTEGDSDVYVVQNDFAAGGSSGWHTHPGPSLITVTVGQITAYESDGTTCTPKVYMAGQTFVDPGGGHVHMLRNETGAAAQTIVSQIVPKGAPRRIDASTPANCP